MTDIDVASQTKRREQQALDLQAREVKDKRQQLEQKEHKLSMTKVRLEMTRTTCSLSRSMYCLRIL